MAESVINKNVLVTGASGYMGRFLIPYLSQKGVRVIALVRKASVESQKLSQYAEVHEVGDLVNAELGAFSGVDCVLHLAGRAHVMNDKSEDPYQAYYAGNVEVTKHILQWSKSQSVSRFVYVSSIKAVGEETFDIPYDERTECLPEDDYGLTKLEAEEAVRSYCNREGMDYVIARPCLIYGNELVGNLHMLAKLMSYGFPLPFKSIRNERSLVSQQLLAEFLYASLMAQDNIGDTFLLADQSSYSLPDILNLVSGVDKSRLFSVPDSLLKFMFSLPGLKGIGRRLMGNLRVDASKSHQFMNAVLEGRK